MVKVQIKSEKLTSFGGIFPIMEKFDRMLSCTIDSTLGLRSKVYGYQYSEIIRSLMCVYFCGGSCVEDVTSHLMEALCLHPPFNMADSRSFVDKYPNESKSLNTYYKDQELGASWGYVTHGIAKSQSEMDEWTKDNNPSWGSGWGEGDIMFEEPQSTFMFRPSGLLPMT